MPKKTSKKKTIASLKHEDASRKNIPTAEFQSVMRKDEQDWSDLVVHAPPLYIQEKVHPKVLIDDLRRCTEKDDKAAELQIDLFNDFNGLPDEGAKTEFLSA